MCEFVCVCVCVCVTAPLRLGMNGLPHWEQQELFLTLAPLMEPLVMRYGRNGTTIKDSREKITNSSTAQSAGRPFTGMAGTQNQISDNPEIREMTWCGRNCITSEPHVQQGFSRSYWSKLLIKVPAIWLSGAQTQTERWLSMGQFDLEVTGHPVKTFLHLSE